MHLTGTSLAVAPRRPVDAREPDQPRDASLHSAFDVALDVAGVGPLSASRMRPLTRGPSACRSGGSALVLLRDGDCDVVHEARVPVLVSGKVVGDGVTVGTGAGLRGLAHETYLL